MNYCPKCGAENQEDAKFCAKCGAALNPSEMRERRGDDCFGPSQHEEECFGLRQGGAIFGILFGAFIIIVGLALFLGQSIAHMLGPFIVVAVGILVIIGAVFGLSQRRRN